MSLPYMPLYVSDYLADTRGLSTEESGAYLHLLMSMWLAGGLIPGDESSLAKLANLSLRRWRRVRKQIEPMLARHGEFVTQQRLLLEREKANEKYAKKVAAGKASAHAKALKSQLLGSTSVDVVLEQTDQQNPANHNQSQNQSQDKKETPPPTGDGVRAVSGYEQDFEAFWKSFGAPKNASKPDGQKAWKQTRGQRPAQADLLKALDGYLAWLGGEWKRNKREFPSKQHPATWLRGEMWNGFLSDPAAVIADSDAILSAWGGRAAKLADEIGHAQFGSWFGDAVFEIGPPVRITVSTASKRNWIRGKFLSILERLYGQCDVVTPTSAAVQLPNLPPDSKSALPRGERGFPSKGQPGAAVESVRPSLGPCLEVANG